MGNHLKLYQIKGHPIIQTRNDNDNDKVGVVCDKKACYFEFGTNCSYCLFMCGPWQMNNKFITVTKLERNKLVINWQTFDEGLLSEIQGGAGKSGTVAVEPNRNCASNWFRPWVPGKTGQPRAIRSVWGASVTRWPQSVFAFYKQQMSLSIGEQKTRIARAITRK